MGQYVISDPPNIIYKEFIKHNIGVPTVVWQQQMEHAFVRTYNATYNMKKLPPKFEIDYTTHFNNHFRPLPQIEGYDPHYIDPEYNRDPYWDEDLYDQENLQFIIDQEQKPQDDSPDEVIPTPRSQIQQAFIEIWEPNEGNQPLRDPPPPFGDKKREFAPKVQTALLDETPFLNVMVAKDGEPIFVPLSTNLGLKYKRRMLYFPMDFGELTIDGLVDTGALASAIPEADLRKIRLLAPKAIIKEGPAPGFQIMVANGQLEKPKSTV